MLDRAGVISGLRLQPSFVVQIGGKPFCNYTADFIYKQADGIVVIEELKSSGTAKDAAYRLRRKAAELYFGITVTEVIR
jgi:hypothetical protein